MIATLLLALGVAAPAGPPVVVTVDVPAVTLPAGGHAELEVVARIRKGFRIQANPASQPFLVPALLEVEEDERVELGPARYPPGRPHRLLGTSEDLSVYEDEVVIRLPIRARSGPGSASPGESVLAGRLRYQACNDEVCLRPSEVPVKIRVAPPPPRTAKP